MEVYRKWCLENNEEEMSHMKITQVVKRRGWESRYNAKGSIVYVGLSLLN
jgi:hypothetical protein